jgi:hypothetical protein
VVATASASLVVNAKSALESATSVPPMTANPPDAGVDPAITVTGRRKHTGSSGTDRFSASRRRIAGE